MQTIMTPDRWQQINTLLNAVMDLHPDQQRVHLEQHCAHDSDIRREVFSLLEARKKVSIFLEEPARDYAAVLISEADNDETDPMIGKAFDGYRIMDVLGRGGMGVVYKAYDINLDKVVALKMINPDLARTPSFIRRFSEEARAQARIDSPYIVRVHAKRQTDTGLYLVMEFVDGGTAMDVLKDGPLSWPETRPLIRQMLMALEHAHSAGVIHRDVKPSNIMLTQEGKIKVTDFGLAKLYQDQTDTVTQGIAGTLFYMSPEQVRGLAELDHRTDLYSMGMTIYQMLAGVLPFDQTAQQFGIMQAIVKEKVPPLTKFRSDLPRHVVKAMKKALEKDRDRRFQSAAEMRAAFDVGEALVIGAEDETLVDSLTVNDLSSEGFRTRLPLWIGVVVLVFMLVLTAWYIGSRVSPSPHLLITTIPTGAEVYLEGQFIGTTPIDYLAQQEVDGLRLRIHMAKYMAVDTIVTMGEETITTLHYSLTALVDTLGVASSTIDTVAQVDDENPRSSTTPAVSASVEEEAIPKSVAKDPPASPSPPKRIAQMGSLTLYMPEGDSLSVMGAPSCTIGLPCEVEAGMKTITFWHPTYGKHTRQLTVGVGERASQTFYFNKTVNVQVQMEDGSEAPSFSIRKNGETNDKWSTPGIFNLGPGAHTFDVNKHGYIILDDPQTVEIPGFGEETVRLIFRGRKL